MILSTIIFFRLIFVVSLSCRCCCVFNISGFRLKSFDLQINIYFSLRAFRIHFLCNWRWIFEDDSFAELSTWTSCSASVHPFLYRQREKKRKIWVFSARKNTPILKFFQSLLKYHFFKFSFPKKIDEQTIISVSFFLFQLFCLWSGYIVIIFSDHSSLDNRNNLGASDILVWLITDAASLASPVVVGSFEIVFNNFVTVIWDTEASYSVSTVLYPSSSLTWSSWITTRPFLMCLEVFCILDKFQVTEIRFVKWTVFHLPSLDGRLQTWIKSSFHSIVQSGIASRDPILLSTTTVDSDFLTTSWKEIDLSLRLLESSFTTSLTRRSLCRCTAPQESRLTCQSDWYLSVWSLSDPDFVFDTVLRIWSCFSSTEFTTCSLTPDWIDLSPRRIWILSLEDCRSCKTPPEIQETSCALGRQRQRRRGISDSAHRARWFSASDDSGEIVGHYLKASWYDWRNKWRSFRVQSGQDDWSCQIAMTVQRRMSWKIAHDTFTSKVKKWGKIDDWLSVSQSSSAKKIRLWKYSRFRQLFESSRQHISPITSRIAWLPDYFNQKGLTVCLNVSLDIKTHRSVPVNTRRAPMSVREGRGESKSSTDDQFVETADLRSNDSLFQEPKRSGSSMKSHRTSCRRSSKRFRRRTPGSNPTTCSKSSPTPEASFRTLHLLGAGYQEESLRWLRGHWRWSPSHDRYREDEWPHRGIGFFREHKFRPVSPLKSLRKWRLPSRTLGCITMTK